MATALNVIDWPGPRIARCRWLPLTQASSDGAPFDCEGLSYRTVHVKGTFGGATVTIQGSNDRLTWVSLTDLQSNPIAKTVEAIESVIESPRYLRPLLTGGVGSDIRVTFMGRTSVRSRGGGGLATGFIEAAIVSPPINVSPPSFVVAAPLAGDLISYVPGVWTGAANITHEWYLDGVATGLIGNVYDTSGHGGSTIKVRDIATNAVGSATADSISATITPITLDAEFGSGIEGFDLGTMVAAEGVDFATGYFSVAAGVTATRSFTAITSGICRLDFAVRITDTQTIAGTTRDTFIYMLPTAGAVSSANALTTVSLVRNTAEGSTTAKIAVNYRTGAAFTNLVPSVNPRNLWIRLGFVFNFTDKTFDVYVNDVLWAVSKAWGNAAAADLSRFIILNQATVGAVDFDAILVRANWVLPTETLGISDDFTLRAGEIETTTPDLDMRSLYSQPWLIPDVAGTGGFLRGASGLVPDASADCVAMVRCGRDGVFETDWVAASSGNIYMGIAFRVWAGIASDSCDNFRYYGAAAAGQKLVLLVGSVQAAASDGIGVVFSASGSYTFKVICRGIFAYCYVNNVLQFGGPVNIGNRGMLSEEHAGPLCSTTLGSTTNRCRAFRWTGYIAPDQEIFTTTIGNYTVRKSGGFIKDLYHLDLTLSTRNLFWSKGLQHSHISQGDMSNNRVMLQELITATHVRSIRERGPNLQEDDVLGDGESYTTLLRRGPWIAERITYTGPGGSINFTPDMDLRPELWSLSFRSADGSGVSTLRTAAIGDNWTTVESSTTGCKALQTITSGSGNKLRLTAALRDNLNTAGKSTQVNYKRQGIGDPFSLAFNLLGSNMTYGTTYEFARAVLIETGSLSLDGTVLTDWRDDIKTPATLTFTVGSIKTNAAGDLDVDGFNERYGWHEVNCSGGAASFTLVKGTPNKRHMPVFRLNSYTLGASPTVTIAGVLGVINVDYVIDNLSGSVGILQLLTNRTADTTIAVT